MHPEQFADDAEKILLSHGSLTFKIEKIRKLVHEAYKAGRDQTSRNDLETMTGQKFPAPHGKHRKQDERTEHDHE